MIENINKINLEEKVLEKAYEKLDYDLMLSLADNYELVNYNIEALKNFNLDCINDLFLNMPYLFLYEKEKITKKLSKYNSIKINKWRLCRNRGLFKLEFQ